MSQSIYQLVATEAEALTPTYDTRNLKPVPFGIKHVDEAMLMGVEPGIQGINVIQGPMGSRKTTIALNIIRDQCLSGQLPQDHKIIWWSIENSMTIERIEMILRSMVATKLMIYSFHLGVSLRQIGAPLFQMPGKPSQHDFMEGCMAVTDLLVELFDKKLPELPPDKLIQAVVHRYDNKPEPQFELGLKPDVIKRMYVFPHLQNLTPFQADAYRIAGWVICRWPLKIYGPSEHQDRQVRKQRAFDTLSLEKSVEEWNKIASYGNTQLFVDHITAFHFPDLEGSPYQKQNRVVPVLKKFSSDHSALVWAIMQEGVGNAREFDAKGFVRGAEGGDTAGRESDNNWRKDYKGQIYPNYDILYYPVKSRHGHWTDLAIPIEQHSGTYFGESVELSKVRGIFNGK